MGHMKKYRCPVCSVTDNVVGFGRRKKVLRYFCKACQKHFSVDPCFLDTKTILSDHLDGLFFRDLARRYCLSPMKAWRICEDELRKLPNNNQFTFNYCSLFSNTFVFDGKYFNLASKDHDWVFLWGIDYFRHDIPVFLVAPSENYQSWSELTGYRGISGSPVTNNIMEGLNSHLESILASLCSFQSLSYAKLWFNGYVLKRRFTPFTDCRGKFRSLNGKRGVDLTKKPGIDLPSLF